MLTNKGHGGQTADTNGDEEDGSDEVIYPVDFRQVGHIVDDQMHQIMVSPLPAGVRLTAIFDSCHSGSVLDLPYLYSTQGVLKEPNLAKEAGMGLLNIVSSASKGDYDSFGGHLLGFFKKATTGDGAYEKSLATKTSPADVISWSGSKDDQTSYVFRIFLSYPVAEYLSALSFQFCKEDIVWKPQVSHYLLPWVLFFISSIPHAMNREVI